MKRMTVVALLACMHICVFQSVLAQQTNTALVPLPSLDDFTKGNDGWAFGLGLGIEYETAYEGSDEWLRRRS